MSFIVKGAEMPKTCLDCPLSDIEQGWCDSDMVTIIDFNEPPVECPLVALPDKPEVFDTEKMLVNVNKGQDAYSVIGNYIRNHITAIEDMIAVIQINGVIINELYMVDVDADGYFYWRSDWWEGEEDVSLLDFFPVSDAYHMR